MTVDSPKTFELVESISLKETVKRRGHRCSRLVKNLKIASTNPSKDNRVVSMAL